MSKPNGDFEETYYRDPRIGRKPQPGDDDVSPWKYYGTIALLVLVGVGVVAAMLLG